MRPIEKAAVRRLTLPSRTAIDQPATRLWRQAYSGALSLTEALRVYYRKLGTSNIPIAFAHTANALGPTAPRRHLDSVFL